MADTPDIIIRTVEELEAERQVEESFPWEMAEGRLDSGKVVIYLDETPSMLYRVENDYIEFRTWRFKTEESCLVFAAAMIRDMRKDGATDIGAPYSRIYSEYPDRRLRRFSPDYEAQIRDRDRPKGCVPLVW